MTGTIVHSRQMIKARGKAEYEIVGIEIPKDPEVCKSCGGDIVKVGDEWWAVRANWPNLHHCYNSAGNSSSVPHEPS